MPGLRWAKLQDFCLRLGLLKAIVALFPANRQSVSRDQLLRSLNHSLFQSAWLKGELVDKASVTLAEPLDREVDKEHSFSCADAVLIADDWRSWGQPIRKATSYKILEWAMAAGLVGPGYRITERGLTLQLIMGSTACESIRLGDLLSYNPFVITEVERIFFLYHIAEIDELTIRIALAVGRSPAGTVLVTADVHRLASSCLESFLRESERTVPLRDLPRFRAVRQLASRISDEISDEVSGPVRRRSGSTSSILQSGRGGVRRTTKNIDHQAIPRCEQLVDLGLLAKPVENGLSGKRLHRAKTGWTFLVEPAAVAFAGNFGSEEQLSHGDWLYSRLSSLCMAAYARGFQPLTAAPSLAMEIFEETFMQVRRPTGMTPFESVAIMSVLRSFQRGVNVEIGFLHRIMLDVKQSGDLDGLIAFAAGNSVERMFIALRPGFAEAYKARLGKAQSK